MKACQKFHCLALGALAVGAFAIIGASPASAAPSAGSTTSSSCPNGNLAGLATDNNVQTTVTNDEHVTTYSILSLNKSPVGGVPGLISYCVYPTGASGAPNATASYGKWTATTSPKAPYTFSFGRPNGNSTNIPFDGKPYDVGTADWGRPALALGKQTIVLHVADRAVCTGSTDGTCWVKPGTLPPTGPICDQGDSSVAYNAMPFDVVNCLNPGVAFQANQWNEFGDSVTLKTGTGRTLKSLIVDFQSFACLTGTWDNQGGNGSCGGGTTPGVIPGTYRWPITANIYAADTNGLPTGPALDSTSITAQIPFRPNADSTCPANAAAPAGLAWFNPGAGKCQNSIATKLTFDFSGTVTLPDNAVWTVAFNTSTSGYVPQGDQTPICVLSAATTQVCPLNPADSLNVGDKTYGTAPYAGSSLFDTKGLAVGRKSQPASPTLGFFAPDDGGRPLGEIITS
jgi:hypothetical protein